MLYGRLLQKQQVHNMSQQGQRIAHAFWESNNSGTIILSRPWFASKHPPIQLDPHPEQPMRIDRMSARRVGELYRYYAQGDHWFFILRTRRHPKLKKEAVNLYLAGEFNGWEAAIGDIRWQLHPIIEKDEISAYELVIPFSQMPDTGSYAFKFVTEDGQWLSVPDSAPNRIAGLPGQYNYVFDTQSLGKQAYRFQLDSSYLPKGVERIVWASKKTPHEYYELPRTQFLTQCSTPHSLGAIIENQSTRFRLFAPRAETVDVVFSRFVDMSNASVVAMRCIDGVTWQADIEEDLSGAYYHYRLAGRSNDHTAHFDRNFPILDPYAKACVCHRGPGIVLAPDRLQAPPSDFKPPAMQDLVIMEAHIRDLAAHAPIELNDVERRGFKGLEKWLAAEHSYIKEMGVNAVELQPIQEFDNTAIDEYHWGYMTCNYFSPESSYATAPERASQIEEFRALVQAFHDAGIAVILDVVYNHVGEPNHLLFIDKYYYFNLDDSNDLMNWSGCGNDLRCETPMGRRLIIDSLKHLVQAFGVDGFRFDLAELIGVDVLREIETELKQVKPEIILIAEPWSFRGHIQDALKASGYASWNDGFREGMVKYVRGTGNQDMIRYFLSGSPNVSRFAAQSINYTESHDDLCWLDRITESPNRDGRTVQLIDRRRTHLMASILFTALGIPMLAAGQDLLRSKSGVQNTYQRGDLNALDYNQSYEHAGTQAYFKAWIAFRQSADGRALRLDGPFQSSYINFYHAEGSSAVLALFNADCSRSCPQILFAVNPHPEFANIACPDLSDFGLLQIADHERFVLNGLSSARFRHGEGRLHIPPMACGLWLVNNIEN